MKQLKIAYNISKQEAKKRLWNSKQLLELYQKENSVEIIFPTNIADNCRTENIASVNCSN